LKTTVKPNSEGKRIIILTHDIDWPLHGPGKAHVLARQDRFTPEIISRVQQEDFNPYFGIPKVMAVEQKFGVRSTFFFRPRYDNGCEVGEYKKTIHDLMLGGWEVGLHANDTATLEQVKLEKKTVEAAMGKTLDGCRVHYLKTSEDTFANLSKAGIKYDSSVSFDKQSIDPRNTGYLSKDGLTVFPITFMDAYLFTYLHLTEDNVVKFVVDKTEELFASGAQILTFLWHDNSVMMKGGRMYPKLVEQLAALDVRFLTGIQAFNQVKRGLAK
jgi:peptidoglycan/xylan/chitin deacetylase (PgdA/CDA1 family)